MEQFFKLSEHKTTVSRELIAGLTTFMTMAYILAVNPFILGTTGMDKGALFTATALAAIVGTVAMGMMANLPFALAPGMGLNAIFAFTIVGAMGYSWQTALTAVLIEGIIFILLTFFNVREAIINAIPLGIKHAISVGIGLFIALIGFVNAGIVQSGKFALPDGSLDGLIVSLGDLTSPGALVAIIGLLITGVLLARNVRGAILIGIAISTAIAVPFGLINFDNFTLVQMPPSLSPILFKFEFSSIFNGDMLVILFTLLFVDMFDTVGTLIGVSDRAGMLDKDGKVPNAKQALMADAIGTTVGAVLGTSTVTTYVESAAGVADGGRTGLTAMSTAFFFAVALFFAPLFLIVPAAATAPALIIVGMFMMAPVAKIKWDDFSDALPAFLTFVMMPFTYSIADGIIFGIVSYVVVKVFTGKSKDIPTLTYVLAAIFIAKFIIEKFL
ncbi:MULTISPECIES: NCS2 family permease [unclassified Fusibacter]|uniref:NCS2 family permease n=1 Tax=unclassified Fusibacter TaxID=2624464 RepID=UPI001010DB60|nr:MULTISPECIES: NCS2 family permease [unclassified Fusibacter]MCK8059453.1 NCS2 family permease [Fusibacter sp. A2]NPE21083.1 NCS2 family permease [Fusibacter sp. A1]RXV62604.1 NCS2 family permease [Fusibacter sp. A1]